MPPLAGVPPRRLVFLLHGLGADGDDLLPIASFWAPLMSDALFLAPHGVEPCDMAPFGRQWFSARDLGHDALTAGAVAAVEPLNAYIDDALERHGLGDDDFALMGFSQGCIMALQVAYRRPRPCVAVVGYAGMLLGADDLVASMGARPPTLLVHGDADPVVSPDSLPAAVEVLKAAGVDVRSELRPGLGHSIDTEGIEMGGAFIAEGFARR